MEIKEYVEKKVMEHFRALEAIQKCLNEDPAKMAERQEAIARYKASNPTAGFEGVRQELTEVITLHYNISMVSQSRHTRIIALHELALLINELGLEFDFPEDVKNTLKVVSLEIPYIHEEKNGLIAYCAGESAENIKRGLEESISNDDFLAKSYERFDVTKA